MHVLWLEGHVSPSRHVSAEYKTRYAFDFVIFFKGADWELLHCAFISESIYVYGLL